MIEQNELIRRIKSNKYLTKAETDYIVQALEETRQYKAIEKRLADMFGGQLPLSKYVDELELALKEPDNPHPINAKILTYEDSAKWETYKVIGTVEECREAMEKQRAKKPLDISTAKDGNKIVGIIGRCPCCNDIIDDSMIWCDDCGQKLDWSEE
jgi:hypothetical protein